MLTIDINSILTYKNEEIITSCLNSGNVNKLFVRQKHERTIPKSSKNFFLC